MSQSLQQKYSKQPSSIYLTNIKSTQIGFSLIGSALMTSTSYYAKPVNQIPLIYGQLHKWIDTLEDKVKVLLQKQSVQLQFAYRNHLIQLKKQLAQLKAKSQQQQKYYTQNTRIQYLQRQMILFREQALKYSEQLQNSKSQNDKLKLQLDFTNKQILTQKEQLKRLMKVIKCQDCEIQKVKKQFPSESKDKIKQNSIFNKTSSQIGTQLKNSILPSTNRQTVHKPTNTWQKNRLYTQQQNLNNDQRNQSQDNRQLTNQYQGKYQGIKINNRTILNKRFSFNKNRQNYQEESLISKRKYKTSSMNMSQFQVKNLFLECVKSVKNDISHRKMSYNSQKNYTIYNWMNSVYNLQDFKAVDKHRILQMFVKNDSVVQLIYTKLKNMTNSRGYLPTQNEGQSQRSDSPSSKIKNPILTSQKKCQTVYTEQLQILEDKQLKNLKTAQIFQMERIGYKIKYVKNQKNLANRGHGLRTFMQ